MSFKVAKASQVVILLLLSAMLGCAKNVDLALEGPGGGRDLALTCRRDDRGRLVIRISNRGNKASQATTTSVIVAGYPPFVLPTRPILAQSFVEVSMPLPDECAVGCRFEVQIDARDEIAESDEENNSVQGTCNSG